MVWPKKKRDRPPKHQALKANAACIHKFHRTVANKEALFNCEHSPRLSSPGASAEGAHKNTHLPFFYWKGLDYILYKLPEGLASN